MKDLIKKISLRRVLFGVQLLSALCILFQVVRFGILPVRFGVLAAALLVGMLYLTGSMLLPAQRRKALRVVGGLLAVLCAVGSIVGTYAAAKAYETLRAMETLTDQSDRFIGQVNVYVLKEDEAHDVMDLKGETFGVLTEANTDFMDFSARTLERLYEEDSLSRRELPTLGETLAELKGGSLRAVLLDEAAARLLRESGEEPEFFADTRVLFEIPVEAHLMVADSTEDDGFVKKKQTIDVTKDVFAVYLSGMDTREEGLDTEASRSDVNIIAFVNPVEHQVLLLNTPRDYYIPNPAGRGALDKLTHCGMYGVYCSMLALENLYEADIRYYAQINFAGMSRLVDALGGITVNSDADFSAGSYHFHQGANQMNGEAALAFCRERYTFEDGDNARGRHQMAVIRGIAEKAISGKALLSQYSVIMDSLKGMFITNFGVKNISALVSKQLVDMRGWDIKSYAVTGFDARNVTYSLPGYQAYVMVPNEETVAHAKALIQKMVEGQLLTQEDMELK